MGLEGRNEQKRKEEITDRGSVGGYLDWNPIYRAMCITWFGTRTAPDYDTFKDEGRTAVHADRLTQHTK